MNNRPTVFVVDDAPEARESVAAMIRARGLHVETYGSAEAFLDRFDRRQLGCLVTDMKMNGISGLELQEKLRADGVSLPVIVVTGYGDVATALQAMRSGAVTMLEKPCKGEDLWQSVCDAIDRHRQHRLDETRREELQGRLARLTTEEREVVELVKAGVPNKVIASRLDVSLRTVELRRSRVMQKMEAESLPKLIQLLVEIES